MQEAAERRIAIIKYLCECRSTTVEHLAEKYGVCERTIRRDLGMLTLYYPIEMRQGYNGGVYLDDRYHLYKQYLKGSQEELIRKYVEQVPDEEKAILLSILSDFGKPKVS